MTSPDLRVHVPDDIANGLDRLWAALAQPGCSFSSPQRIDMTLVARAAADHQPRPDTTMPEPILRAVEAVAVGAHHITAEWVDQLEADGVRRLTYLEILGVVALANAADTLAFGLGLTSPTLKRIAGNPTGGVDPEAAIKGGWAPTVGQAFAHNALSALPDLHTAKLDFTESMYLAGPLILDLDFARDGLTRDQIELVATRTSRLNECFF
ncbi:MAG: hypothetical protein HKN26_09850 [Acidimicrobiales bacterium]|nr:hypothetical protein [Acidimicrobiales bacterium]